MSNVILTGASSGIGRSLAHAFGDRGDTIALLARREEALKTVADEVEERGGRALILPVDVRDAAFVAECVQKASDRLGEIDIAVANAGIGIFAPFSEMDAGDLRSMMEINYFGMVNLFHSILPRFLERGAGHLAAVASIAGRMGYAGMAGYCATKFAILGFLEGLHGELQGTGIHVTAVCPGEVKTEFFETADHDAMPAASRLIRPLGAEEVARAAIRAIDRKKFMVMLPWTATLFMKFHDIFPGLSRWIFFRMSSWMRKK